MRLHIIIGYPTLELRAVPVPVYVGRDGQAAKQAMADSACARFEILNNPPVIRKNNPAARANAAALEAREAKAHKQLSADYASAVQAGVEEQTTALVAKHEAALGKIADEKAAIEKHLAGVEKHAAGLEAQLKKLTAKAGKPETAAKSEEPAKPDQSAAG